MNDNVVIKKTILTESQSLDLLNKKLKEQSDFIEGMQFESFKPLGDYKFEIHVNKFLDSEGEETDLTKKSRVIYDRVAESILSSM